MLQLHTKLWQKIKTLKKAAHKTKMQSNVTEQKFILIIFISSIF